MVASGAWTSKISARLSSRSLPLDPLLSCLCFLLNTDLLLRRGVPTIAIDTPGAGVETRSTVRQMPELPEMQASSERFVERLAGGELAAIACLGFSAQEERRAAPPSIR